MSKITREQIKAAREGMRGGREIRRMPSVVEMREVPNGSGGTWLVCSGYASVTMADQSDLAHMYEIEDMFGVFKEGVVRGAFRRTLREGADVALLTNHTGVTMARTKPGTLRLSEDDTGLHYEGRLNPSRPDVQILRAAIEDGAIDESSFAFRVVRQKWTEDYSRRWIQEVDLNKGDVSPVNFAASPLTAEHPLTVRGRRGGSGDSRGISVTAVVLPDYTTQAQLALAEARGRALGIAPRRRRASGPRKTAGAPRGVNEARSMAAAVRLDLAAARRRGGRSHA